MPIDPNAAGHNIPLMAAELRKSGFHDAAWQLEMMREIIGCYVDPMEVAERHLAFVRSTYDD